MSNRPTSPTQQRQGSRPIPGGPRDLRYYPQYRLVAWQPEGPLDDALLDELAAWVVKAEEFSLPFSRYVDLSCLTSIALRDEHLSRVAEQARQYHGLTPVRCALYCPEDPAFSIARHFERLMESSGVEARAVRERAEAASWLGVPAEILSLADEPRPQP